MHADILIRLPWPVGGGLIRSGHMHTCSSLHAQPCNCNQICPSVQDREIMTTVWGSGRWTNGLFKSTLHRVITDGRCHRYSLPFFFEPNFDTCVECLPSCCSVQNPPRQAQSPHEHFTKACMIIAYDGDHLVSLSSAAYMITACGCTACWAHAKCMLRHLIA